MPPSGDHGKVEPVPTTSSRSVPMGDHYEDMGRIAVGGMGEVRRAWDVRLNRSIAMKILRSDLFDREDLVLRFIEESQATAQLEHPGIVPIYDSGTLPDGRPYFTMKEIRGRTLLDVIEELHQSADSEGWGITATGWTFQRVIQVFQQVCEATAYAHSRGVLHRDLKPTNVMVGPFGEVVVMDWGLAKVQGVDGFGQSTGITTGAHRVVTDRSHKPAYVTRSGSVAGTPNYMPPEQARGEGAKVGPWSDVYALGAVLYEILTDRPPYMGDDLDAVVEAVLAGPPPPIRMPWQREDSLGPEDGLRAICRKAIARDLADRYMDATTLAEAVAGWLDSLQVREQAVALVRQADQLEPILERLRTEAATLRAQAATALRALPPGADDTRKRHGWSLEDRANALDDEVARHEGRYVHLLRAALTNLPGMPDATQRLRAIQDARASGRSTRRGPGYLSLHTEVPCRAVIKRFEVHDRRLRPNAVVADLLTPIDRHELPAGSYRVDLYAEGHVTQRVLAEIELGGHCIADPPGPRPPVAIQLAQPHTGPEGVVRIPPGWAWLGGDRESRDSEPRTRMWTEGYAIQVFPVTVQQYAEFLDALGSVQPGLVQRFRPNDWTAAFPPKAAAADEPVRGVSFEAAWGYANWLRETTSHRWRLPSNREWEKAARGVDERTFPWGDYLDTSWCCVSDGLQVHDQPTSVHAFPLDESPWGVRGMGGNVRDWVVADAVAAGTLAPNDSRWVRGGHFRGIPQFARSALRYRMHDPTHPGVGFRLVCDVS